LFDENLGFTLAHNILISEILETDVCPDYFFLLNNDTTVDSQVLENLISHVVETNSDLVSCKMIQYYDRNKIDNVGHLMLNSGEILPVGRGLDTKNYTERMINVGACAGAAFISTQLIRNIGFFDEHFDTGYEDAEFGLRAKLLGYNSSYEPKAIVYHKGSTSLKKVMNLKYESRMHSNMVYTYLKLMPMRFLAINIPLALLKYIIILFLRLITLQVKTILLHVHSIWYFCTNGLIEAIEARKAFYACHKVSKKYQRSFLKPTLFFVTHDFRRSFFSAEE